MKILSISTVCPYPLDAGGSIGYFKALAQLQENHDLTLICPEPSPTDKDKFMALWPDVNFNFFKGGGEVYAPTRLRRLVNLFKPKVNPSKLEDFRSQSQLDRLDFTSYFFNDFIDVVQNVCDKSVFDLIQVDFIDTIAIGYFLPKNTPKIFVHHEIKHRRLKSEYELLGQKDKGDLWFIENIKALEVSHLNTYDKVIVLTEIDKNRLVEDGVKSDLLTVSPLAIELKDKAVNQPFVFKNKLAFLGPDNHYPNLDGVDWFLEKIWPGVSIKFPDLQFEIIGNWSQKNLERYKNISKIKFSGYVKKLETSLDGAIMIVPLRIGGGMRMKILEGASFSCPIISTRVGAEGLPVIDNEQCLLADTESEFSAAIDKLLNDSKLQNRLIQSSKAIFKESYSEAECGKIREQIINSLTKK